MGNILNTFVFQAPPCTGLQPDYIETIVVKHSAEDDYSITYYYKEHPSPKSNKLLIYSHGNSDSLCNPNLIQRINQLSDELEVSIACYDYLGYGWSRTHHKTSRARQSCTEELCYISLREVINFFKVNYGLSDGDIILVGHSLGCGPVIELASRDTYHKIICISPFTSVLDVGLGSSLAYDYAPVADMFENKLKIKHIKCPVKILHGMTDNVIPFSHGKILQSKVPEEFKTPFEAFKDTGHNEILTHTGFAYILHEFIHSNQN